MISSVLILISLEQSQFFLCIRQYTIQIAESGLETLGIRAICYVCICAFYVKPVLFEMTINHFNIPDYIYPTVEYRPPLKIRLGP